MGWGGGGGGVECRAVDRAKEGNREKRQSGVGAAANLSYLLACLLACFFFFWLGAALAFAKTRVTQTPFAFLCVNISYPSK